MGYKWQPSDVRIDGDVARITLSKGLEAVVDVSDAMLVTGKRWCAQVGKHGHAYAYTYIGSRQVALHRYLLDTPKGVYVDHEDGDGLNNRRSNIRNCTQRQNMANRPADRRNALGIKGVSAVRGKFSASISTNGRKIYLGMFQTTQEACAAYIGAARVLWGDFAKN